MKIGTTLGTSRRKVEYTKRGATPKKVTYNYQYVIVQDYINNEKKCMSFGNIHDDQSWIDALDHKKGKIEKIIIQFQRRLNGLDSEIELKMRRAMADGDVRGCNGYDGSHYLYIISAGKYRYVVLRFHVRGQDVTVPCGRVEKPETWMKAKRQLRGYLEKKLLVLFNMLDDLSKELSEKRSHALLMDKMYNYDVNDPPPARILREPVLVHAEASF